jgi:phosphoribosylamine---glycine ligase
VTIVLASGGYPGEFKKGKKITGLEGLHECVVFHAGTSVDVATAAVKTTGGRVLTITSLDYGLFEARKKAYENAARIQFESVYYRKDIGLDLMNYRPK